MVKTAAVLVLLVVLVGCELRKSFGITRQYKMDGKPLDESNKNNDAVLPRNFWRTDAMLMQPRNDDRKLQEVKGKEQSEIKVATDDNKKNLSNEDKAPMAERRNLEYA